MHWLLDAIVIAVIVICAALGWRRGFIKSVSGLLGLVLGVVLVAALADPVGQKIDESLVRPWAIEQIVHTQGEDVSADTPLEQLDLASINQQIAQTFDVDILGTGTDLTGQTLGGYVEQLVDQTGITASISRSLATVVLFLGSILAVWLLSKILIPILKLPVLRQFNGLLGLVVGLVNAAIVLVVIATAVHFYGATAQGAAFGAQEVEKTVVYQYIDQINPVVDWIIK